MYRNNIIRNRQKIIRRYLEARTCGPYYSTLKHDVWAPNTQVSLDNITSI